MTHPQNNPTEALLARLRSGSLSAEEALALNDTLEHLEAQEEALEGDTPPASFRDRLKRPVQDTPPLSSFEQLCYKELEGELAPDEQRELEAIVARYPHYAQQRAAILRTKLEVPTDIVYPYKERLKHHPVLFWQRPLVWKGISIAACLGLLLWLGISRPEGEVSRVATLAEANVYSAPQPVLESAQSQAQEPAQIVAPASVPSLVAQNQSQPTEVAPVQRLASMPVEVATVADAAPSLSTEAEVVLTPLPALEVLRQDAAPTILLAARDPMPEAYHDWEAITAAEEVAAFESEVESFQRMLRREPPLHVKFVEYVLQLAAR